MDRHCAIKRTLKGLLTLVVLLGELAVLTGCSQPIPGAPGSTPTPPLALPLGDAQRIAADFLNAWMVDNYDAMYALLTSNSRDAFPRLAFEKLYRDTEKVLTLANKGKSYTLLNAIHQGAYAEVAYDVTFQTQLFGTFSDTGRIIRLVVTSEGWRVGWTQGDVFAEFKDGGSLQITQTKPNRGAIYGQDGEVIADQNGERLAVTLRTEKYPTDNPDACFAALAAVFPARSPAQMKALFGPATHRDFAYEVGEISLERFAEVRTALEQVCTLEYARRPSRRYVAGGLAPHVIGYVGRIPAEQADDYAARGYPKDALVGIDGIEKGWEKTLAGRGEISLNIETGGQARTLVKLPPIPPQSVYLTLNRKLQEALQFSLNDAFTTSVWGPRSTGAAAVVMDVKTGEILAIASYPDFNVDAFNPYTALPNAQDLIASWEKDQRRPLLNRATLGQYPPGSVFKIITVAAGLDSGKFDTNSRWTCTGTWDGVPLGDRLRKDWIAGTAQGQHGTITLLQGLTGSCNIWMWHIAWTLNNVDPNLLPAYAKRLGLGAPTGIIDVGEASGNLPDPANHQKLVGAKWQGSDALNTAIGQGQVVVTPLQIVRMVAAVANGGTLWQPMLIKQAGIINDPSFVAKPTANGGLNLKSGVLDGIRKAMCEVVTNPTLGTAYFVFKDFKGAVICGKTGTAETPYGIPHAWFAAYAGKTAADPEIAIVVIVERSHEGSYIAAPIARRLVEVYYDLPLTPWPSWYGNPGQLPDLTEGQ